MISRRPTREGIGALLAAACVACASCGPSTDDAVFGPSADAAPPPVTEPQDAGVDAPKPPTPPGVPCTGKAALSGDLDWKLAAGGLDREVHVHLPKGYDPTKATPVVLNFHGLGSNATEQRLLSGMDGKADTAGFIAVHAEGTGVSRSWNAGVCCGTAVSGAVDDVGFVGKMIDELEAKLCVDTRRVFATGMSNGGFLSHRLACEMSSRIAAIAPVAGVLGVTTCTPSRPMSVFQFHGTLDGLVPYNGNPGLGLPAVVPMITGWASRSGCGATPRETSKKGEVTCVTFDGCKGGAEVNLCTVTGGGHTWPGGVPVPSLGHTTNDIIATDAMWDFFVKHPM